MALFGTAAEIQKLAVQLDLVGNFGARLGRATRDLNKFDSRIDRTQSKANQFGQHIGLGIRNLARLGLAAAGAISTVAGASVKLAGDFEAQLNTINTIARTTPEGLSRIGDQIRAISRETGTSLDDLTKGYYDLLSAGIKTADAQKVLEASNRLAIGGLSTTAEAIDLLTTAINSYGGKAKYASKIADIFAKTVERGKVTAAELAASFAEVGPIAAQSGVSIRELGAIFARLTATGVPAAQAATQIRAALVALQRQGTPLRKLEKQTGRNYLALAGKKGLVYALGLMRKDAEKAGVPLVKLLGRADALTLILATTGKNSKAFAEDLAAMGKASGTAAAQMAEREKGLNFQLERLKALAKDAGITIGSKLLPKITPIFERINQAIQDNQPAIADFGDTLASLFSKENVEQGIGLLKDLAPVMVESARVTASLVGAAVAAFKSLPPQVQALAVGALAVNKLTGGIVTTLAGGIFDQLFARGSNPANPMWVAVTGTGLPGTPLPGTPTPPGGPPGGIVVPPIGAGIALSQDELMEGWRISKEIAHEMHSGGTEINSAASKFKASLPPLHELGPRINRTPGLPPGHDVVTPNRPPGLPPGHDKELINHVDLAKSKIGETAGQLRQAVETRGDNTRIAIDKVPPAIRTGASDITGAIRANRPVITTKVTVNVTAAQVSKSVTIQERYGSGNGSYGGGHSQPPGHTP